MKAMLMLGMVLVLFTTFAAAVQPGSIWTTREGCGDPQNENHYAIGDRVFINGANFDFGDNPFAWDITGQPGQASCDPDTVVASGNVNVNEDGSFCFDAYTVAAGDCGEYKVTVGNKHDNYRVDDVVIPEFGLLAAAVAVVGAAGAFFLVRRK